MLNEDPHLVGYWPFGLVGDCSMIGPRGHRMHMTYVALGPVKVPYTKEESLYVESPMHAKEVIVITDLCDEESENHDRNHAAKRKLIENDVVRSSNRKEVCVAAVPLVPVPSLPPEKSSGAPGEKKEQRRSRGHAAALASFKCATSEGTTPLAETIPLERWIVPGDSDVICGRGSFIMKQVGNQRFRELVDMRRYEYQNSTRMYKSKIAQVIVDVIEARGGKFIIQNPNTLRFEQVSKVYSREKVSHALRGVEQARHGVERAAICRAQKERRWRLHAFDPHVLQRLQQEEQEEHIKEKNQSMQEKVMHDPHVLQMLQQQEQEEHRKEQNQSMQEKVMNGDGCNIALQIPSHGRS